MEKVVSAIGLTKNFNGFKAVDNVSFHLNKGEILGLLGPNGAGKTTTIHMLLGLTTPTSGEVKVFGKSLEAHREEILSRVNFSSSYVSLPYSLTVMENLLVFARIYGVKEPKKKIMELLSIFEIDAAGGSISRKLSSGQMTRVSLVKSLLNDPDVLFLDEPTASLAPDMADRTRRLLRGIRDERGLSIIYTSHNMSEMAEMCDKIVFLDKGKVAASGTMNEVLKKFNAASLEEVFLKIARQDKTMGI